MIGLTGLTDRLRPESVIGFTGIRISLSIIFLGAYFYFVLPVYYKTIFGFVAFNDKSVDLLVVLTLPVAFFVDTVNADWWVVSIFTFGLTLNSAVIFWLGDLFLRRVSSIPDPAHPEQTK